MSCGTLMEHFNDFEKYVFVLNLYIIF